MKAFNERLIRFIISGNETEAIRLIQAGENANIKDGNGSSVMHLAAQFSNESVEYFKIEQLF